MFRHFDNRGNNVLQEKKSWLNGLTSRAKRGKKRASKSQLVRVLLLIGREGGARFFNQSQSEVKQNESKTQIAFETQLKTALLDKLTKQV